MAANNKCSDCGIEREPKYKNDSCCQRCRKERNRAKRAQRRLDLGRHPYGSGRSPNCSKCGAIKDDTFRTSGYCRNCRAERLKQSRVDKRREMGLRPHGSGRDPFCYECKGQKENPLHGYCNACANTKERERYAHNRSDDDFVKRYRKEINDKSKFDPVYRHKKNVRLITHRAIKDGILTKQPCSICGEVRVDAHHDDYMEPLKVRWLCRKHHNEHHRNEILKL